MADPVPSPDPSASARDFLSAGAAAQAVDAARRALADHPDDPRVVEVLVLGLIAVGRAGEARDDLQAARAVLGGTPLVDRLESLVCTALGDHPAAARLAASAAAGAPRDPTAALRHGRALARTGQRHAALEELHRALELDDSSARAWDALAELYELEDSLEDALFASTQAATLARDDAAIQSRHAHLLARSGELEAAVRTLHTAVRHHPDDPRLQAQLSALLDRPVSAAFLAWVAMWLVLMGVSLLLGVVLDPMVGALCFLFMLVGMIVWGTLFSEDSERTRLEAASPGVTAVVDAFNEAERTRERTEDNPWNPPESPRR